MAFQWELMIIECVALHPSMNVSHEVIYQSLFVQGRGELRRELARCLRSGRTQRRPQGRGARRGKIPGMVMISERPARGRRPRGARSLGGRSHRGGRWS